MPACSVEVISSVLPTIGSPACFHYHQNEWKNKQGQMELLRTPLQRFSVSHFTQPSIPSAWTPLEHIFSLTIHNAAALVEWNMCFLPQIWSCTRVLPVERELLLTSAMWNRCSSSGSLYSAEDWWTFLNLKAFCGQDVLCLIRSSSRETWPGCFYFSLCEEAIDQKVMRGWVERQISQSCCLVTHPQPRGSFISTPTWHVWHISGWF